MDSVKKSSKDAEPAKTLSDDEDVVRIMTIHKSKGLEFPIVFICNSTKQFTDTDIRSNKIITHPDRGFGLNFYDFDNYYYYELPQKKLLKEIKRTEMLSEEMRVLYVALTRAREKLIITGTKKNIKRIFVAILVLCLTIVPFCPVSAAVADGNIVAVRRIVNRDIRFECDCCCVCCDRRAAVDDCAAQRLC